MFICVHIIFCEFCYELNYTSFKFLYVEVLIISTRMLCSLKIESLQMFLGNIGMTLPQVHYIYDFIIKRGKFGDRACIQGECHLVNKGTDWGEAAVCKGMPKIC